MCIRDRVTYRLLYTYNRGMCICKSFKRSQFWTVIVFLVVDELTVLVCGMWNECRSLVSRFHDLLNESSKLIAPNSVTFFIDGTDDFDTCHQPTSLSWLPEKIPQVCSLTAHVMWLILCLFYYRLFIYWNFASIWGLTWETCVQVICSEWKGDKARLLSDTEIIPGCWLGPVIRVTSPL